MTQRFLKAKHWQIFLLTFGVPMTFQLLMMARLFINISSGNHSDSSFGFDYMNFYPLMMIMFLGVFFGWQWSVVTGLQTKIPEEAKMKLKRFKIFFFIPLIYFLVFLTAIGGAKSGMMTGISEPDPGKIGGFLSILLTLHLFSMFCIFHSLYFAAKAFKTAELQRRVTFSDFAGEFFMIWFYPIGIWIVQPKINRMVDNEEQTTTNVKKP